MGASPHPERARLAWQGVWRARHAARLPRYLALAALLLFCLLGLRTALFPSSAPSLRADPVLSADAPSQDFALQFARAYLSFDAAHPGRRTRALAAYLGESLAPGAGLEASHGSQRVRWAEVASDQPAAAGGRLVTVAASVSTQRLPLYLALDVRHRRGQPLELLGYPALVGAPAITADPTPPSGEAVDDPALREVVERVLRNYLALNAPDLKADLAPQAEVTLPTRRLRLTELEELTWLGQPGSSAILATVTAADSAGTTYTLAYELGIAFRERPYVEFIEVIPTAS